MNAIVDRNCESYRIHHHFHLAGFFSSMGYIVRYQGKWIELRPRAYEPERMTTDVAWIQIKEKVSPAEAYRRWFILQRKLSRLLQQ